MKKLPLHWWILVAMAAGVGYGVVMAQVGATAHVLAYIKPAGTLFLNLLKMIAVPLVLFSLIAGVASLNDTSKLGRIGGRTVALYLGTTAVAITIGLIVASIFKPGAALAADDAVRTGLQSSFSAEATTRLDAARQVSILDQLVGIVPTNPFAALAEASMLQVVFFALILGVALTKLGERAAPVVAVFQVLTDAVIEVVHLIMTIAPIGVFALMAALIADLGTDPDSVSLVLRSLVGYMLTVAAGLVAHVVLVYLPLVRFVAGIPVRRFLRAMAPAQLVGFSTSSSAATLPVTMNRVEQHLGVGDEVSSFVLPLGATVNMDGTGLYQGVAAVFIATAYGLDLTLGQQFQVVLTATLASIGTAAVPGVGIVMLTIVLAQIGIAPEGIALVLGVDRPLDMLRTSVNVTGDATVAACVAASEGAIDRGTALIRPAG